MILKSTDSGKATMKFQEDAQILGNRRIQGDYYQIDLATGRIAAQVEPGQFVHLQIPTLEQHILRRPFSVYDVDPASGRLSIIYKIVGEGTRHLSEVKPGTAANLLGPLGRGYTSPTPGSTPIIVAGGYGCAATYLLAKCSPEPGICLIGGKTTGDLLLVDEFTALGTEVRVSTEDGSQGHQGLVTELLDELLASKPVAPCIYACGPNPMLKAVGEVALKHGIDAEISLDHVMCCGVGACFTCVIKLKADNEAGWEYVRTCREGPVFKASQAYWE
jgi:dihydroorotate dehydrogenase electron transfer subunit